MTDGMGLGELMIVAVVLLVPLIAVTLLVRTMLRALARRGTANGELASLRDRVARLEAERGTDPPTRDRRPGAVRR